MNKKIAYITDLHLDEDFPKEMGVNSRNNWAVMLNDVSNRNIDEIIFGGDIGEPSSNEWFFETLKDYNYSISLGNHDRFEVVVKHYDRYINKGSNELYHSREVENCKFIYLDSSAEIISDKQFAWFKNELNTPLDIVILIHHPLLASDCEVDKRFALSNREALVKVLLSLKQKTTIFSGHYHLDDKIIKSNIVQYITPASSYQAEKTVNEIRLNNKMFGYRIIEFGNQELMTELISFSNVGQVITKTV